MKPQTETGNESYYSRNAGWVRPLLAGLIFLLAPLVIISLGQPSPFPAWLPKITAALAFAVAGFYAALGETFSSSVVRFVAPVVGLTMLMWAVLF